ncbi:hypothetical protein, partial [Streptomyces sp. NPDC001269]
MRRSARVLSVTALAGAALGAVGPPAVALGVTTPAASGGLTARSIGSGRPLTARVSCDPADRPDDYGAYDGDDGPDSPDEPDGSEGPDSYDGPDGPDGYDVSDGPDSYDVSDRAGTTADQDGVGTGIRQGGTARIAAVGTAYTGGSVPEGSGGRRGVTGRCPQSPRDERLWNIASPEAGDGPRPADGREQPLGRQQPGTQLGHQGLTRPSPQGEYPDGLSQQGRRPGRQYGAGRRPGDGAAQQYGQQPGEGEAQQQYGRQPGGQLDDGPGWQADEGRYDGS